MAFRSSSIAPPTVSTSTTISVPVPLGSSSGDAVAVAIFSENDITSSRGSWQEIITPAYISGSFHGRLRIYWARLDATEAAATEWLFTHSGVSGGSIAEAISWSGRFATGNPFDFWSGNAIGNVTSGPFRLGGLANSGSDIGFFLFDWNGNTGMTISGYTQRASDQSNGQHMFTLDNTSGQVAPVVAGTGLTSNNSWWGGILAVKPESGSNSGIQGPFDAGYNQTATGQFATTITLSTAIPSGATIIVSAVAISGMILSCSDSKSGTWSTSGSMDTSPAQASNNSALYVFRCKTATAYAPGDTITVTRTNGTTPNLIEARAVYFTGVDSVRGSAVTSSGLTSATNGAATTLTLGSVTTAAGDRVFASFVSNGTQTASSVQVTLMPGTGFGQSQNDAAMYSTTGRSILSETAIASGTSVTPTTVLTNGQASARTWGGLAFALTPATTTNDAQKDLTLAEIEKLTLSTAKSASPSLNVAASEKFSIVAAKSAGTNVSVSETFVASLTASRTASADLGLSEVQSVAIGASRTASGALNVDSDEFLSLETHRTANAHLVVNSVADISVQPYKSVGADLSVASEMSFTLGVESQHPGAGSADLILAEEFSLRIDISRTGTTGLEIKEEFSLAISGGTPHQAGITYPDESSSTAPTVTMIAPDQGTIVHPSISMIDPDESTLIYPG